MTSSTPATDVVLPLRPHVFDPLGEQRQLQLTLATALPPVCLVHGRPATGPRDENLRFWGKPGSYRQEGFGRLFYETIKKLVLGRLVIDCNEPTAVVKATWPECERCAARSDTRVKTLIAYYVCSLFPLVLGGGLYLAAPSSFAVLCGAAGILVLIFAVGLGPVFFARMDRYLVATIAPDAGSVTLRVHPDFAHAWSGPRQPYR
ncbi:hypothetical protein [Nocardia sp. AG03]|uniref:hypothetical protein n=1 Tax=Nocardia sp. AG03 TaxID=3025312 RepID=UPI0024185BC0|nr:hypothetical protein [Nocardia sp. AG03]